MTRKEMSAEERMRYRDLVLQIRRFLKFAPNGTSEEVLAREARMFHGRIAVFEDFDGSGVRKLQRDLERLFREEK
jgi:hypothetical protein